MHFSVDLTRRCRQLHGCGDIATALERCTANHGRVPELSLIFHESMILRIGLHMRRGDFFARVVKWFLARGGRGNSFDASGILAQFPPHDAHLHIIGTPLVFRDIGDDLATFGRPRPTDEGPAFCLANEACDQLALGWTFYGQRNFLYLRFDDGIALADMRARLRIHQRALYHLVGPPDVEDPVAQQRLERLVLRFIRDGAAPQIPVPMEAAQAMVVSRGPVDDGHRAIVGEVAGIIAEHVHADDLAGEIIDEARLIAASAIVRDRLERYFDSLLP